MKTGFGSKFKALRMAATDAGTDYSNAETQKFINERTLEQFDIIEATKKIQFFSYVRGLCVFVHSDTGL